jgi:ABC-type transport system involved in multi-copper enzyme maturation permease subunit
MADRSERAPALFAPSPAPRATFAGGLLHYRPWQGTLQPDDRNGTALFLAVQAGLLLVVSVLASWPTLRLILAAAFVALWGLVVRCRAWPIARVSLAMIFQRRLFWALYGLALMVFLLFFFGQYLMSWAATQIGEQDVRVGGLGRANPRWLVDFFRGVLRLDGSAEMYRNFFSFEAYNVMIVLALAGAVLIGNDIRFGSLPFYLAKPISRADYLLGKGLAVALFVNLMTTVPAIALYVEYGLLESWDQAIEKAHLVPGILGYGLILSASMTVVLLAVATWVRRTVPLILTWTTVFFFSGRLARALVDGLHFDARWRLIDLWNDAYLLGNACLGIPHDRIGPLPQPAFAEAAVVLALVCAGCLAYLVARIRAVEIIG